MKPQSPLYSDRVTLTQAQLAHRWGISPRTLERWRWVKTGPAYIKIGHHVIYRITDVEEYEAQQTVNPASVSGP